MEVCGAVSVPILPKGVEWGQGFLWAAVVLLHKTKSQTMAFYTFLDHSMQRHSIFVATVGEYPHMGVMVIGHKVYIYTNAHVHTNHYGSLLKSQIRTGFCST